MAAISLIHKLFNHYLILRNVKLPVVYVKVPYLPYLPYFTVFTVFYHIYRIYRILSYLHHEHHIPLQYIIKANNWAVVSFWYKSGHSTIPQYVNISPFCP
jgi:hypothetical protein